MSKQRRMSAFLRNFTRNRGGSVLIMFAGMAVGLLLMVGAGVDYGRAVQFKAALQSLLEFLFKVVHVFKLHE